MLKLNTVDGSTVHINPHAIAAIGDAYAPQQSQIVGGKASLRSVGTLVQLISGQGFAVIEDKDSLADTVAMMMQGIPLTSS